MVGDERGSNVGRCDPRLRQRHGDGAANAARTRRHHHHAVSKHDRLLHVMGDEEDRHAPHVMDAKELAMHAAAGLGIEP
jgi:hypothetical protein